MLSKDGTSIFIYVLIQNAIYAPIVGLSSVERITEVVETVNLELTEEEFKHLEEPSVAILR